jgi:hypothetical protein
MRLARRLPGVGGPDAERLLAEHRDPLGGETLHQLGVLIGGRGDKDALHRAAGQKGVDVGVNGEPVGGKLAARRGQWLPHGGELDQLRAPERAEMHAAHAAGSDEGDPYAVSRHVHSLDR